MRQFIRIFLLVLCFAATATAQQNKRYSFDNFDARGGVRVATVPATDHLPQQTAAATKAKAKSANTMPTTKLAMKATPSARTASVKNELPTVAMNKFDARIKPVLYAPARVGAQANPLVGFTTGDTRVDSYIVESGTRNGVDPALLYAIMHQESSFKPRALSHKGAAGLMQMMPGTAARFGVRDRYDPKQSVEGGARYMRFLLNYFDGDYRLALAGYNAGEGAVLRYGRRVPPYRETQDYVRRISARYEIMRDPAARQRAPRTTPAEAAQIETPAVEVVVAVPTPPSYERAVFAVRLPDGKLRLVSQ